MLEEDVNSNAGKGMVSYALLRFPNLIFKVAFAFGLTYMLTWFIN